jgi:C4-type Zn-finger protein
MSGRVDLNNPESNMFGCLPCPKCKSIYRIPHFQGGIPVSGIIECEACGFTEPITEEPQ